MRGYRDRDFMESVEGLMFCVIGNVHPSNRVVSFLKYVPNYDSPIRVKWSRNGIRYGRILPYYSAMGVKHTLEFLKKHYPEYIVFDKYRQVELIEVPKDRIKVHYRPEERLQEILDNPTDPLEEMIRELVIRISEESGISLKYFGVTGSILLRIHNLKYSDIDLIVYGKENSYKVKEAILRLLDDPKSPFSRPYGSILEEWAKDITRIHPLTLEEAKILYGKYKWNRILYRGRQFSIHPVKLENEVNEKWEHKIHKPIGIVELRARVVDASDSLFMPAVYLVDNVEILNGARPPKPIDRVVSYEGLYFDIAGEGEEILVKGKLELVNDVGTNEAYCQVTVGTFEAKGEDYIKPAKWLKDS